MEHPATHGHARMLATARGIIGQDFDQKVLSEFHQLNTQEARASFARSWLKLIAINLGDTIPIIYTLAALVREQGLHSTESFGDPETFPTFETYWATRFGELTRIWREYEAKDPLLRGLPMDTQVNGSSEPKAPAEKERTVDPLEMLVAHMNGLQQRREALLTQEQAVRQEREAVEAEMATFRTSAQETLKRFDLSPCVLHEKAPPVKAEVGGDPKPKTRTKGAEEEVEADTLQGKALQLLRTHGRMTARELGQRMYNEADTAAKKRTLQLLVNLKKKGLVRPTEEVREDKAKAWEAV